MNAAATDSTLAAQHTPGPWRADDTGGIYAPNGEPLGDMFPTRDGGGPAMCANAAFIVRACNSHDQLAETVRELGAQLRRLRAFCADKRLLLNNDLVNTTAAALQLAEQALIAAGAA